MFNPFDNTFYANAYNEGTTTATNVYSLEISPCSDYDHHDLQSTNETEFTFNGIDTTYTRYMWTYSFLKCENHIPVANATKTLYWYRGNTKNVTTQNLYQSETPPIYGYIAKWEVNYTDYTLSAWGTQKQNIVLSNTETGGDIVLEHGTAYEDPLDMSVNLITGFFNITGYNDGTGIESVYSEAWHYGYDTAVEDVEGPAWWEGYNTGYDQGKSEGYNQGLIEGNENTNVVATAFDMFGTAFETAGTFLSTEILPGINIGTLAIIPTLVTLLMVIIRILKK